MKVSPGCSVGLSAMIGLTVWLIAPRCTGMCGALTTRSPAAVKMAQEKSRRSLTFTLMEVLRSVMPICVAIAVKWLLKSSRRIGSGADCGVRSADCGAEAEWERGRGAEGEADSRRSSPPDNTMADQLGSRMVVVRGSRMRAGQVMGGPGGSWWWWSRGGGWGWQ